MTLNVHYFDCTTFWVLRVISKDIVQRENLINTVSKQNYYTVLIFHLTLYKRSGARWLHFEMFKAERQSAWISDIKNTN